ncbi:hypothetical protein ACFPN2_01475 [Steroidobacter flavus]|uniref:Phosphatidic acid phosphatase type 2/haloperoxidase domain-containing protein n=1 Tax=Steroidobacter flavus TaxID=1842136 RepID=A0ABV8SJJ5_9GAMM
MTWETWDAIADSYIPILALIALLWPWLRWRGAWQRATLSIVATLVGIGYAYALSALDGKFGWWPALGLDFSTHTAVAIALVVALCAIKPQTWMAWTASLLAYFVLMVYQRYHTWADILTTAVVIAPPLIAARWRLARHQAGQIV